MMVIALAHVTCYAADGVGWRGMMTFLALANMSDKCYAADVPCPCTHATCFGTDVPCTCKHVLFPKVSNLLRLSMFLKAYQ